MPSRVEPEDLDIEHVREARHRKPVRRLRRREGPPDASGRYAPAHVSVGGNVIGIVKIDEIVALDRQIGDENREGKSCVDPKSGEASGRQATKIIMTQ